MRCHLYMIFFIDSSVIKWEANTDFLKEDHTNLTVSYKNRYQQCRYAKILSLHLKISVFSQNCDLTRHKFDTNCN